MRRDYYLINVQEPTKEHFEFLFNNNIIAIGYQEFCFTMYDGMLEKEELYKKIADHYKSNTKEAEKSCEEAKLFINIKAGDYIIVSYFNNVCLAIATHSRVYDRDVSKHLGFYNQLEVDYIKVQNDLKIVPKHTLSKGLQNKLKEIKLSICKLNDFGDEIEHLVDN